MDVGICPLGHRVSGVALYDYSKVEVHTGRGLPRSRAAIIAEEFMDNYGRTPADELIKLHEAGLLSTAEATYIARRMFPELRDLEQARITLQLSGGVEE